MSDTSNSGTHEVIVTDIKIPFWSMVVLMVKWAIAAIPALIILIIIISLFAAALGAIFGSGWHPIGPGHWM